MANTIAKQTLQDGERNLVVKVNITGDGSGEETATQLIDVSSYTASQHGDACTGVVIDKITSHLDTFQVELLWDATTDVQIVELQDGEQEYWDFTRFGGAVNNAGTGKTGDIMFTTIGLGSGDNGFILFEMTKKY